MSNIVAAIAQRKKAGSGMKKAVLMYFADRASDDGSGVWSSKSSISKDTEISVRSVQNSVKEMLADGLISEVGHKACKNGYTVEYRINMDALNALDCTRAPSAPLHDMHPTHAPDAPLPLHDMHPNNPITILEPPLIKIDFSLFWNEWPNKVAKPKAEAAWKKLSAEDHHAIMSLPSAGFESWQNNSPAANPIHPASFLNGRRWEDTPILSNGGQYGKRNHNGQTRGDDQFDEAKERAIRLAGL